MMSVTKINTLRVMRRRSHRFSKRFCRGDWAGKHEETDDDLIDDLKMQPVDGVKDQVFESDFEEMHDTDEEIDNLYNARDAVMNRMVKDEYFNMDDKKWDGIVGDAIKHGIMKDERV